MDSFKDIIENVKKNGPKKMAVVAAHDKEVLKAVKAAIEINIVKAALFGNYNKILKISREIDFDLQNVDIIDIADEEKASFEAVKLVSEGKAQILMKGLVDTSIILKAVLNKDVGLRTDKILSHGAVFFTEKYHKMLIITDAAMNIAPNLNKKKQIIENAVELSHSLGIKEPKCSIICAKEKVNPAMIHTVDAAELVKMNISGEIKECIVGGPFALDNAISKKAAKHKGIYNEVAGESDILLMPNIETGNVLYKALAFMANSECAGIILGASAPIVLTSRSDSEISKLNSIALAVMHSS